MKHLRGRVVQHPGIFGEQACIIGKAAAQVQSGFTAALIT
jgi:hypothetical protein